MSKHEHVFVALSLVFLFLAVANHAGPFVPVAVSIATGPSMYPAVEPGEMLVSVSRFIIPPAPGSIVIYKAESGCLVSHRVIEIGVGYVVTKGDNNPLPDGKVPLSRIFFVVVSVIPVYVWVPALAAPFSLYAFYLVRRRAESALIVFIAGVIAISVGFTVNMLTPSPVPVKPNPLPVVSDVEEADGAVFVKFSNLPDGGNISCRASGLPVPCKRFDDIVFAPGVYNSLEIHYTMPTPYHLEIVYNVTVGR